ncbi:hypothetical protein [Pseudomonas aeruginosa]|uniref:hypothetical protein n=1 Tax=Pseudomonas aeruginosa TaxID=287 RepID=UPI000710EF46|nr:hypothetical protein [Pseudomonas aeruginosa]
MSDRELLELAAEAVGYDISFGPDVAGSDCCWKIDEEGDHVIWCPLEDDGDAFRLACSLRLDISFLEGFEQIIVDDYHGSNRAEEDYQPDMAAAARRAVVRAAADIGRTMK